MLGNRVVLGDRLMLVLTSDLLLARAGNRLGSSNNAPQNSIFTEFLSLLVII